VKRCLPERMSEASQRRVHQAAGSCAWEAAQRGMLCGSATSSRLTGGEAYDLHPPHSCFSFPPGSRSQSRCFPCVLHPAVVHC
jgi:hypothetical protein